MTKAGIAKGTWCAEGAPWTCARVSRGTCCKTAARSRGQPPPGGASSAKRTCHTATTLGTARNTETTSRAPGHAMWATSWVSAAGRASAQRRPRQRPHRRPRRTPRRPRRRARHRCRPLRRRRGPHARRRRHRRRSLAASTTTASATGVARLAPSPRAEKGSPSLVVAVPTRPQASAAAWRAKRTLPTRTSFRGERITSCGRADLSATGASCFPSTVTGATPRRARRRARPLCPPRRRPARPRRRRRRTRTARSGSGRDGAAARACAANTAPS